MSHRSQALAAFLLSLAAILLEVSYTRIFSFKLVYYFTYLIIGIALLGLGSGGVLVAISTRLRAVAPGRSVSVACLAGAAATLAGYLAIALIPLNAFDLVAASFNGHLSTALREGAKLLAVCLALFAPFLCSGVALAILFASAPERIHLLYGADLLGAALGCAIAVPLIEIASPPGAVMLGALCCALAGLGIAVRAMPKALLPLASLAAIALAAATFPDALPDPVPDRVKSLGPRAGAPAKILFSRWSPVFRVDVASSLQPDAYFLVHDGTIGSVLTRWDGDPASLERFSSSDRSYPFRVLDRPARVAIIGSAGGGEILASLYFGAERIVAVELNPVTVALHRRELADFLGHLAEHPRVDMVNAEGRSFLRSGDEPFDLIWYVAPDTYASANAATSGGFVLSESYLYTVEAIQDSFARLTDDGIVAVQFGETAYRERPKRTVRYIATARQALARAGISDFARHILVATAPGFGPNAVAVTILLKKAPFSAPEVARFVAAATIDGAQVVHVPGAPAGDDPVSQVIRLEEQALGPWLAGRELAADPVTDDSPFFWHFVRFRDATRGQAKLWQLEDGLGELLLLVFLGVAALFAALFLLSPLVAIRPVWRSIPYKGPGAIYFAALGLGFMLIEVSLIQRLTLFLGYPTHSLTVTLFALLLSSGIGSLVAGRVRDRNRALRIVAAALVVLIAFDATFLTPLLGSLVGLPLVARIAVAIALVAPLGFFLGGLLPLGLQTMAGLTPHRAEIVAWGWSVNGFFSVLSSILATILAMTVGFNEVLWIALAIYLLGIGALLRVPSPTAVRALVSRSAAA